MLFDFTALADALACFGNRMTPALAALEEVAELMLGSGECRRCSALGGHEKISNGAFTCRECRTTFAFELV